MTLTTRLITLEEAPLVHALVVSRASFIGITDPDRLEVIFKNMQANTFNMLEQSNSEYGTAKVMGCFDGETLVGVLYSRVSDNQVCWFLVRAHTLKGREDGAKIMRRLIGATVEHYLALGYQRWYTVYRKSELRAYPKLGKALLDGTIVYTEIEVPPDVKVKQIEFWEKLYGRMLVPETTVVRCYIHPMKDVNDNYSQKQSG